jgi:hypothetical protein
MESSTSIIIGSKFFSLDLLPEQVLCRFRLRNQVLHFHSGVETKFFTFQFTTLSNGVSTNRQIMLVCLRATCRRVTAPPTFLVCHRATSRRVTAPPPFLVCHSATSRRVFEPSLAIAEPQCQQFINCSRRVIVVATALAHS